MEITTSIKDLWQYFGYKMNKEGGSTSLLQETNSCRRLVRCDPKDSLSVVSIHVARVGVGPGPCGGPGGQPSSSRIGS
jgi:hypothetical protein